MATNLTQRGPNANRAALLPALPDSQRVTDPVVRSQLELIREWLEVRLGSRGDRWERAVTFRDLEPLLAEFDRRLKVLEAASGVATPDNDRRLRALAARVDQMAIQSEIDYTENIGAITRVTNRVRDAAVEDVTVFAHAMRPTATGGCSAFTVVEFGADEPNFHCLLFDKTLEESADFPAMLPFSWVGKMFRVYVYWGHGAGATSYGVVWRIQANSTSDNEQLVLPFDPTGFLVSDTGGTSGNLYIAAVSDPIEVTSNMTREGDIVNLRITRVVGNAGDTLDVDAALLAVRFTLADVPHPVPPTDPYWADVLLLCLMEGTGSTLVDSSTYARTITANGTPDTLSIPVTQGTGSFPDFPSLKVTVNASPDDPVDWSVAESNDFKVPQMTIEYFWYQTSSSGHTSCPIHVIGANTFGVNQLYTGTYAATGRFNYGIGTEAQNNLAVGSLTFNAVHHVAAVIDTDANTVNIWIDGTRVAERTGVTIGPDMTKIHLGWSGGGDGASAVAYTYEVSQIRITAAARYSGATITVPTGPFPTS